MSHTKSYSWRAVIAISGGVLVAFAVLSGQPGRGQNQEKAANPPVAKRTPFITSATDCAGCHNQDKNPTYPIARRAEMICRMNEWQYYNGKDKHQKAFEVLSDKRSEGIVSRLGLGNDATTVRACLNCHALPEAGEAGEFVADRLLLAEGVTCVACHGAFSEWATEHQNGPVWRGQQKINPNALDPNNWINLNRKDKETRKGMTDLWDPVRRVEVCASCHIGNLEERKKKVVTHAMYAAGHPPLPSFEAATFSEFQPRHWQYLREKDVNKQNRLQPFDLKNLEQSELVAVTGLVVLREYMKLLADEAKADLKDTPGAAWPDLARYDCRACHHELKSSSEAVFRPGLIPGRPAEPTWTHTLVPLGIVGLTDNTASAAIERERYESIVQSLHAMLNVRIFGDSGPLIKDAERLASWADELLKRRSEKSRQPIDRDRALALFDEACKIDERTVLDYDSARQRAWAIRAIYKDLLAVNPKADSGGAISSAMDQLEAILLTKLPSAGEQSQIEQSIKTRLEFAAQYDQRKVRDQFQIIRQLVPGRLP
ncbi:MAG TPA: multiheme c-type cytochrome [Isosphaeraceae bacterium]|nr:multiheme c-type cytochrome [Isosphaeraceae bacterium]